MNEFKNWLLLQEDQFDRTIRQNFPNTPAWVRKDLFRDNWLKRQTKNSQSKTPFSDWLNNPQVRAFRNVNWPQKSQCLTIHPTQLSDQSLTDIIVRRFGKKPITTQVFNQEQDQAKTDTQCRLMASAAGPCSHVPIILVQQADGKLRMIEGWHRLMCRLLDGCPEDKKQLLYDSRISPMKLWDALELNTWKPVQINAYVGIEANPSNNGPAGQTPKNNYYSPTAPFEPNSDGANNLSPS